jgi:hypothetical protein
VREGCRSGAPWRRSDGPWPIAAAGATGADWGCRSGRRRGKKYKLELKLAGTGDDDASGGKGGGDADAEEDDGYKGEREAAIDAGEREAAGDAGERVARKRGECDGSNVSQSDTVPIEGKNEKPKISIVWKYVTVFCFRDLQK